MSALPRGIIITTPVVAREPIVTTGVTFTPTTITNCSFWIDANDASTVTSSGGNITGIADKSGQGYNLSNANGFTLSSNFNGTYPSFFSSTGNGSFLGSNNSFPVSGAVTIFAVGSNTSTSFGGYICDGANSSGRVAILDGGFLYTSAAGAYLTGTNNRPTSGKTFIGTWQINGASTFININGSSSATGSLGVGTFAGILVGNRFVPDSGNQYVGNLCEFLIYNRALSQSEYQQVEGYLAWKWGLQTSLPAEHPFLNTSPNTLTRGPVVPRGFRIINPIAMNQTSIALPRGITILAPIRGQEPRASAALTTATFTYTYTGAIQTLSIPSNVSQVTVYMWGAGGGGAYIDNGGWTPGNGGAGAMIQGNFTVTPSSTLHIVVGRAGAFASSPNQSDAQGGGGLGYFDTPTAWGGGSGGGRSAIQLSAGGADVVVAGGGGGGGVVSSGATAGGSATFSGIANSGTVATGGSQIAGGSAGSLGVAGSQKFGGAGWNVGGGGFGGGGGGGGYYGGGGGGQGGGGYGSGGGGSSFTGNLTAISGEPLGYNSSDGRAAPNTSSTFYQSGVAVGGTGTRTGGTAGAINLGGNGLVVIVYQS